MKDIIVTKEHRLKAWQLCFNPDVEALDASLHHQAMMWIENGSDGGPPYFKNETLLAVSIATTERITEIEAQVKRLDPYNDQDYQGAANEEGTDRFVLGVRYYLGMLEDGDNEFHSLGHIEVMCDEYRKFLEQRRSESKS